jgi:hypothetical protein
MERYLSRIKRTLWPLEVSDAAPAGSREGTVAHNVISEHKCISRVIETVIAVAEYLGTVSIRSCV